MRVYVPQLEEHVDAKYNKEEKVSKFKFGVIFIIFR